MINATTEGDDDDGNNAEAVDTGPDHKKVKRSGAQRRQATRTR